MRIIDEQPAAIRSGRANGWLLIGIALILSRLLLYGIANGQVPVTPVGNADELNERGDRPAHRNQFQIGVKLNTAQVAPEEDETRTPEKLREFGQQQLGQGEYGRMIAVYQQLADHDEATTDDILWLAHALMLSEQWEDARPVLLRALKQFDRDLQPSTVRFENPGNPDQPGRQRLQP